MNAWGYVGFRKDGMVITNEQGQVLLFRTMMDARAHGSVKVCQVVSAFSKEPENELE